VYIVLYSVLYSVKKSSTFPEKIWSDFEKK
jgi:hypothetical protein